MQQRLTLALVPTLAWLISKFLFWSFKLTVLRYEEIVARLAAGELTIVAVWHSRALILPRLYHWAGYQPIVVMVSRSFDGQLAGAFLARNGFQPVWGSSTRGGEEALEELIEQGRKGVNVAITPDGPRGPREEVKPGAVRLAAALGAPIYPIAFSCERQTRLGSWDRFLVPHPFSRAVGIVGRTLRVPADADAATLEAKRKELEDELKRITAEAEHYYDAGAKPAH